MVRLRKADFLVEKIEKAGTSLSAIALLINQSFELESLTVNSEGSIGSKLRTINGGSSDNYELNDGNGWNQDTHHDGSLAYHRAYSSNGMALYGTETSTSPLNSSYFADMKEECKQLFDTYKEASGGIYHTYNGSCHVHNSLAYLYTTDDDYVNALDVDIKKILPNIAFFMLKFMPVMKWLTMTALDGARACSGTRFDKLDNDSLFSWYYERNESHCSRDSVFDLYDHDRGSYMRLKHNPNHNKMLHWENRMCDTTASPTHMAMWLTINRAITLLAIDFARNDKMVCLTDDEVSKNSRLMAKYRRRYNSVGSILDYKENIVSMSKQFIGYLGKYFKILKSMEVVPFIEKLIERPFPEYLATKNATTEYNTDIMESVFNVRNRAGDTELRNSFINTLICMIVPAHDSLAEHQESIARFMNVEPRKVKSLYQMLKREQVDIEFISGRLVYMGD